MHTFTCGHNHTGRMQNMGATGFCLVKAFVQMLSMYKAKPEAGFGFSRILEFPFKDAPTVSHDLQGQGSWGQKLCRSRRSTHFWQSREGYFQSWQNTSGCTWRAFRWRTSVDNDTQLGKWERDCGTMDDLELQLCFTAGRSFLINTCYSSSLISGTSERCELALEWYVWCKIRLRKPCTYCAVCIRHQDVGQLPLPLLDGKSKAFKLW